MFVTKKRFEYMEQRHAQAYLELRDKYWALREAHERLLAHFGLEEAKIAEETVLRAKPGGASGAGFAGMQ